MRPSGGGRIHASQAPSTGRLQSADSLIPRGRRLSIATFPNELFIKIFANIATTHYNGYFNEVGSTRHLLPLMATCHQWREIICGTPAFWREIVVRRRLEWLEMCLERSQQLLVVVNFSSSMTDLSRAWHVLRRHKDRITSLYFRSLQCAQIGDRLVLEEMRQLKSLGVRVKHRHAADAATHNGICPPLLLTFPRLEKLRLDGLTVRGPSAVAFSTLRELALNGYAGAPRTCRLTDFLSILQACVSLENLDLRNNALDTIAFDTPQTYPIVALRRLRELSIYGKVEEVSNLVSHLEVGPEVNIWLATEPQEDPVRAALAARAILPSDIRNCRMPILRTATRVKVDLCEESDEEVMMITATRGLNPRDRINILLQVSEGPWNAGVGAGSARARAQYFRTALQTIPMIFPDAPVETLVCHGEIGVVEEATWRSLFSSFPKLRTLVIEDSILDGDVRPAFRALRAQQSPTDPHPVCQHLQYIWVRNALGKLDRLEEIRKCVAWRAACHVPVRRLRLELAADNEDAAPIPDVTGYQAEFARLVADSRLVIWDANKRDEWELMQHSSEDDIPFGSIE